MGSGVPYGLFHGTVPTTSAPAGWVADPLTSALQQLTMAVDPESQTRSASMAFRPELYAQHKLHSVPVKSLDYKKLSYKSLIYGMICVARHIVSTGGSVDSYLAHMQFLSRHACENAYIDTAYAEYDHNVFDKFLVNPLLGFPTADPVALGFAFHPAKLLCENDNKQIGSQKKKKQNSKQSKSGIPEGYPDNNCYYWNYKTCWINSCMKKHICRICDGNHRAVGCPRDKQ